MTSPILLTVALVSTGVWVWADRGRSPATNPPVALIPATARSAAVPASGQALFEQAICTLGQRRSLSAKIRQSGSMFGQEPIGTGVYLQQITGKSPDNPKSLLYRLDLKVQLGEEASILANVLDDQQCYWTYEKVPGEEAVLSRIDVQPAVDYLHETRQMGPQESLPKWLGQRKSLQVWPGLGGLQRQLRSLLAAFDFSSVAEAELPDNPPLPVWRLSGQWKPERLAELLPEDQQGGVVDGHVDLSRLPPQLPEQVVVYLGKDDLFPYCIEYTRQTVPKSDKEQWPPQWFMKLELFEVNFNATIPEGRFKFPTSLNYSDETAAFLDGLKGEGKEK